MTNGRWRNWLPYIFGGAGLYLLGALVGAALVAAPDGVMWPAMVVAPLIALTMLGIAALWLLMLAGFVVGTVVLVRWLWQWRAQQVEETRPGTPLEVLQARYAKGEIEREEYLIRLRDLERAA